ncbi:unnamed protein product, partial [marine sediment metagenome]
MVKMDLKKRLKELLKTEVFKNFVLFSCEEIDFKNDSELSDILDIFAFECVFTSWKLRYEYPRIQSGESGNMKINFQRFMDDLAIHSNMWKGDPLNILG